MRMAKYTPCEAVNAMLLNEFLKEHRKVEDALTATVREVSDRRQLNKPVPQLVANNY